ncbi:2,4-dienoyl-CoA reductase-like NADH-dependent reductase (Old Yellow Enzyme family) [Streptomyces sp. V3I8]|uniref:NADH:flavin oxidoreductase/NADH oxidase n=1 Tax=Streptomyces sp. V3I8 TaxID=3042279 RepID=UPI0027887C4B|nr:NADH:flavin oxidoreductase/NADH oxidase [Streptomyces sp. V3I8]MDQ1040205.1 2,4-dienoyl-CoA reductase-like NADH-dependent reductase (Old Yellow Enzyme family) [Streptomyces sp. V3I8]
MSSTEFAGPEMTPLRLREVTIPNRLWMSPMAQYAAGTDGKPTDWHLVHYGARAVGGVGLVMIESNAVGPLHRTTSADLGIWNEEQAAAHRRLTSFIAQQGAVPAVQLLAAGRKGSHQVPWEGEGQNGPVSVADGGWDVFGPSAVPFGDLSVPRKATSADMDEVVEAFARSARMAHLAGYEVVEIHAAHGYLLHQFLSPLANQRTDEYGGSLQNRMRLPLRVAEAVREAFPAEKPVFVRITATDWAEGGITIDEAVTFAKELATVGIDLLDVTSGVLVRDLEARPPARDGVNVEFANTLKKASGLAVAPVGQIADLSLAGRVLADGQADAVLVGRALLRDPYFALRNRAGDPAAWPARYHRAL